MLLANCSTIGVRLYYNKKKNMISQIPGVTHKQITKLFWDKFAFKVTVTCIRTKKRVNPYYGMDATYFSKQEIALLKALCPEDEERYRISSTWGIQTFYFLNQSDTEQFVKNINRKKFKIGEIHHPESEDHLILLSQDHKIVTRAKLFFNKFEWRVIFKPMDSAQVREVKDWVNGFFDKSLDADRLSFTEGINCILYLRDEDDVMIAKLTQANRVRKIEKVVLLNNNNNKEGPSDESSSVSQTD